MTERGIVIYRGPSKLEPAAPIFAVVTFESANSKTGDMAQAWIMRADASPTDAIAKGLDRAICGDCIHRSGTRLERSCYVVPWFGPLNVFKSFVRGDYLPCEDLELAGRLLAGAQVRVSAYGDPAAIPLEVWRGALKRVAGWTGYCHQWRTCDQRFKDSFMASVESEAEAAQAHALGWRTFRTRLSREPVRTDEIVCPASNEAGHLTTCEACGLCRGTARGDARSVVIMAHGMRVRWFEDHKARAPHVGTG